MSDEESDDTHSYVESEDRSTSSPLMPHPEPLMANKIQLIIEDNRKLKSIVRDAAEDMDVKNRDLSNFYQTLKVQVQKVWNSLVATKEKLEKVQAEKFILEMEAGTRNIDLNGANAENEHPAVSEGIRQQYKETMSRLLQQMTAKEEEFKRKTEVLKRSMEEEMRLRQDSVKRIWEEKRQNFVSYLERMQEQYNEKLQQEQANYQASLMDTQKMADIKEGQLKKQVTTLIGEVQKYRSDLETSKKRVNDLEADKFHMSKDAEDLKMEKRNLSEMVHQLQEELVKTKKDLQKVTYQRNEKEKSLDELFDVYNKDREELQKYKSQQIDHYYAQYISAEESLKKKDEELAALHKGKEKMVQDLTTEISLYKEQAKIFEHDFDMERKARQKLHNDYENAKTMLGQQSFEIQRLKTEITRTQPNHRPFAP